MQNDIERDELVMTLVESALTQPRDSLPAFLDGVAASQPHVSDEVRERVEWELQMRSFMREPVIQRQRNVVQISAGDVLGGRFQILRPAGAGGMGSVYEAYDIRLDRRIALKVAHEGFRERLTPEARAALEVSHVNVCKLYELHTAETASGAVHFLTMEFIDGETLHQRITRTGPLNAKDALDTARQLCAGLRQAHEQGVVHADLKTSNILITPGNRIVITDFGLATFRPDQHAPVRAAGTPEYMAPEVINGAGLTAASDIYALGIVFHVLLTGQHPGTAPPLVLPKRWAGVVARCTAASPADRFSSVGDVERALFRGSSAAKWFLAAVILLLSAVTLVLWQNQAEPEPLVRLATLTSAADGATVSAASAVGEEIAERLTGVRRNFSVIAPSEAHRHRVTSPADARRLLQATHALSVDVRPIAGKLHASATVTDISTGAVLRSLAGKYEAGDTEGLARALTGTITSAFRLRQGVPKEVVAPAAYQAYSQGIALLRGAADDGFRQAKPYLEQAVALDPSSALPLAALAECHLQHYGKGEGTWLQSAAELAAKARSINPDAPAVLLVSGYISERRGQYDTAVDHYTRVTQIEPANENAWRRLARIYQQMDRPADALSAFTRAVNAQPSSYGTYLEYGNFHLARTEYDRAEPLYRKVVELAPAWAAGHMSLGIALLKQGRYMAAEQPLLTAVKLSRSAPALTNLGTLYYMQARYAEALPLYQQALAAGVPTIRRYANLANTLWQIGSRTEARKVYRAGAKVAEEELVTNPRLATTRLILAQFAARLGEERRAEFEIRQALSSAPENPEVLREAARAYHALGRSEALYDVLRRAPTSVLADLSQLPDLRDVVSSAQFQQLLRSSTR